MSKKIQGDVFLLITAALWGLSFPVQRIGSLNMPPLLFSGVRMYLGTASLLLLIYIANRSPRFMALLDPQRGAADGKRLSPEEERKLLMKVGPIVGLVIYFGVNLQQVGLITTSAGKTAFITTLYIVLVPLIGIFLRHKTNIFTWLGVALAVVGLYMLCMTDSSFSLDFGDIVVLICALFWAIHILLMDYYSTRIMSLKIVAAQFFVAGTLSLITSPLLDGYLSDITFSWSGFAASIPAILYVGIFSTAVAFTCQCLGQRYAKPATAAIIMSMESVFGVIFGFLVLHEMLSGRELLGCLFMFAAILVVQTERKPKE